MPSTRSATNRHAHLIGSAIAICTATHVAARPEFVEMIPNGANVPGVAALGHTNNIGGNGENAFGDDFAAAGLKWTRELCEKDSDGDGQHNGAELGDPCCEWALKTNQKVEWIDGVSSPADATKTSDPALWAKINCTTTSSLDATIKSPTRVPTPASKASSSSSASVVSGAFTVAVVSLLSTAVLLSM
ncbi:hypothetical protein Gpo141_00005778 [Globisporangium polare]